MTRDQLMAVPIGATILLNFRRYMFGGVNENEEWVDLRYAETGQSYCPSIAYVLRFGAVEEKKAKALR